MDGLEEKTKKVGKAPQNEKSIGRLEWVWRKVCEEVEFERR